MAPLDTRSHMTVIEIRSSGTGQDFSGGSEMALQAKDIMNVDVVTARDTMPLRQLMILLRSNALSGLAVLDADENIVGVVSVIDVVGLDGPVPGTIPSRRRVFTLMWAPARSNTWMASNITTRATYWSATSCRSPPSRLTSILPCRSWRGSCHDHHIHRVIIVDGGQVAGVVGTMDILKAVRDRKITG